MDILLNQVTRHAMNYAIRSGISITSTFAISQCTRLMNQTSNGRDRDELSRLRRRLESKIRIIAPAIDMIELITARGHTTLESAVTLTKALRIDIQSLGSRLASAAEAEEHQSRAISTPSEAADREIRSIIADMRNLLDRIEDAVPLINLAITTSGANLSSNLPVSVSPSRLLQASAFLNAGDMQYLMYRSNAVQIGPAFTLSMYMLFLGHATLEREDQLRSTVWKEVIHKARVKIFRVPLANVEQPLFDEPTSTARHQEGDIPAESRADEYAYQISIVEDFDDDRVHDERGRPLDDVPCAGLHECIPIHQISKIFYADTGKILNINGDSETNNPVLLLKRDIDATPPRRMLFEDLHTPLNPQQYASDTAPRNHSSLPPDLDPEWIALEVYAVDDSPSSSRSSSPGPARHPSSSPSLLTALSQLHLSPTTDHAAEANDRHLDASAGARRALPAITTSLSLLEMLVRLTSLQQFQQLSHLSISDELLNFFLEESSTTGAAGNSEERKKIRMAARDKVGFDPYNESPIKRREGRRSREADTHALRNSDGKASPGVDYLTTASTTSPPLSDINNFTSSTPSQYPHPTASSSPSNLTTPAHSPSTYRTPLTRPPGPQSIARRSPARNSTDARRRTSSGRSLLPGEASTPATTTPLSSASSGSTTREDFLRDEERARRAAYSGSPLRREVVDAGRVEAGLDNSGRDSSTDEED